MKKKLEKMKDALPGEELLKRPISRKQFVAGAGATSFGLLLAACGGSSNETATTEATATTAAATDTGAADTGTAAPVGEAPLKEGLADGMYGGPVGFPGAERYQYPLDSEEGRAISALRQMKQDGTAPDTIIVQTLDFAKPQFRPSSRLRTATAPRSSTSSRKRRGSRSSSSRPTPADEYQTNLRNASTKNGSFDAVTSAIEEMGDFAEAGLLLPLDDYVDKYQPSWNDPEYGYAGGDTTVTLFTKYKGITYFVAFDNDTQPFMYRSDLWDDPTEQANFADKYGYPLAFPLTWDRAQGHGGVLHTQGRRDAALR